MNDVAKIVAEVERRWRERTPATEVQAIDPAQRVGRGEIRLWAQENGVAYDDLNPEQNAALSAMFRRLRREFPNERW